MGSLGRLRDGLSVYPGREGALLCLGTSPKDSKKPPEPTPSVQLAAAGASPRLSLVHLHGNSSAALCWEVHSIYFYGSYHHGTYLL